MWGPLGKDVSIVRSSYACSPCGEEKYRLCSRTLCMESLELDSVLEAAGRFIL
jgi:hypothetical protein